MRILVITNLYPPHILGGYEILCGQIVERLKERGHDLRVLTSDWSASGSDSPYIQRTLRLTSPFPAPPGRNPLRRWSVARHNYTEAGRILSSFKPEAVLVFSQLRLTLGAARAAERFGCPVLYSWNDEHIAGYLPLAFQPNPRRLVTWLLEHTILRGDTLRALRLRHTASISRCLLEGLAQKGVPTATTQIFYQGIPLENFPCKPDPGSLASPALLLYAGQLHHYKGVHTFLEAAALLQLQSYRLRLIVAGTGPDDYTTQLKDQALQTGLDVEWKGRVSQEELAALYRGCHLFVFPSIWKEPFGLTHLEAMASGLPVLSTTAGGQGEFLRDQINCLSFPPGDAQALASQARRLLEDEALRVGLARAGRQEVETRFNLDNYVIQLENWVEKAVYP